MPTTVFSLVNIPKSQQVGFVPSRKVASSTDIPFVSRPKYETERDVTLAIVSGELKFGTEQAYRHAREYQRYLKVINRPKFFRRKKTKKTLADHAEAMKPMFQK